MLLFGFVAALIIIIILLWLINTYIPMDTKIKKILNVIVAIPAIIWILGLCQILGFLNEK